MVQLVYVSVYCTCVYVSPPSPSPPRQSDVNMMCSVRFIKKWKLTWVCGVRFIYSGKQLPLFLRLAPPPRAGWIYGVCSRLYDDDAAANFSPSFLSSFFSQFFLFFFQSGVNMVYAVGFMMMTPQLFLNYKYKSVDHLPWRALLYR